MIIEKINRPSRRKTMLSDLKMGEIFEYCDSLYIRIESNEERVGEYCVVGLEDGEVYFYNDVSVKKLRENFTIKYSDADLEEWT
jgi:hypothetical protein